MTTLEKGTDKFPVHLSTVIVGGKSVRIGLFTERFYGTKDEFPAPEDCPRCSHPMPRLPTYTGPFCRWINGGCGYFPEGTRHIFDKPQSKEETRDAK